MIVNRGPVLMGNAQNGIDRPGGRHDPAVDLMVRHMEAGDVSISAMSRELSLVRRQGAPITVDVMKDLIAKVMERDGPQEPYRRRPAPLRQATIRAEDIVYYMRIGNRVKIGTTTNLKLRMKVINPEELMATEPGGYQHERSRQVQFRALRTHGEWFKLEGPLAEHIAKLQAESRPS